MLLSVARRRWFDSRRKTPAAPCKATASYLVARAIAKNTITLMPPRQCNVSENVTHANCYIIPFALSYCCACGSMARPQAAAAAAAAASIPAVSTGADIDTDELVDETGVEPKDIELIMSQVPYICTRMI